MPHWSPASADLPATGVTPGTYGDATHVGTFVVSPAGIIVAAADVPITGGGGGGGALASDKKTRTAGDVTFVSTAFAVIDAALNITLATDAHRCLVVWTLMAKNDQGSQQQVDVELDGTRLGRTFGLVFQGGGTVGGTGLNNQNQNLSGSVLTDALTAGSHTFKLMFRVDGNTSTIYASAAISPVVFNVVELYA